MKSFFMIYQYKLDNNELGKMVKTKAINTDASVMAPNIGGRNNYHVIVVTECSGAQYPMM